MDIFCSRDYELTSFTPFLTQHHGVNNWEYCPPNEILNHHYCAARSVNHSIIQLSCWWQRIGDQNQLVHKARHRHWRRLFSQVQDTTQPMTKITYDRSRWVQDDINYFQWLQSTMDTGEVATAPLNKCVTDIEDDDHKYKTILTCQLSVIINPSSYSRQSDLSPECRNIEHQRRSQETISESAQLQLQSFYLSEVHLSQFACTPTALTTLEKPACRSILRPTYSYSYLRRRIWHERCALTEETPYESSSLTATNIGPSEVHLWRSHPTLEGHWGWEAFPWSKQTYSGDTLCSEVHLRSKTDTILHTDYDNYDEFSDYDHLRAQALWTIEAAMDKSSANGLWHSASKNNWRHWWHRQ